jgi:hypothetical protein
LPNLAGAPDVAEQRAMRVPIVFYMFQSVFRNISVERGCIVVGERYLRIAFSTTAIANTIRHK